MTWTPDALKALKRAPFFVRPLVRRRAEAEARRQGRTEIDGPFLEELRRKQHD